MGTYGLPRNVKGEGRILFIFSTKALIYTSVGIGIGLIFYFLFNLIGLTMVGIVITGVLGLLGFGIGTFKMPETNSFQLTKKVGGENIDEVIKRAIRFRNKKNRIYISKEVNKHE